MVTVQSMEDLKFLVDGGQPVTYRWLSYSMGQKIETSKVMLQDFLKDDNLARATYFIGGVLKSTSQYTCLIVEDKDLKDTENLFLEVSSCHVYSVQKQSEAEIFSQISALDMEQNIDLTCGSVKNEMVLFNRYSSIVSPESIKKRPSGLRTIVDSSGESSLSVRDPVKTFNKRPLEPQDNIKTKKPYVSAVAKDFFKSNTTETKSSHQNKSEANSEASNSTKQDEVPGKDITTSTLETAVKTREQPKESKKEKETESSTQGESEAGQDPLDGSDAEWDDGSGFKSNTKKTSHNKTISKRKIITKSLLPDIFDNKENEENMVVDDNIVEVDDVVESLSKKKSVVEGPMNNFMKTQNTTTDENTNPSSNTSMPSDTAELQKKKRKVLVEKMFTDEKGYLVTEMVYEEVTDTEQPQKSQPSNSKHISEPEETREFDGKKTGKTAAKTAQKKVLAEGNVAQKSISSFFGKK